jgi:hypothetical protein
MRFHNSRNITKRDLCFAWYPRRINGRAELVWLEYVRRITFWVEGRRIRVYEEP